MSLLWGGSVEPDQGRGGPGLYQPLLGLVRRDHVPSRDVRGRVFFYFSALYLIESESDWDVGILEEVPLRQAAEDTWCLHGLLGWHIDGDNLSLSSPGRCRPPPSTVGTRSTPPMQHCLKTFDTPSTEYYIPSPISSIFSAWRIDATTQPRVIAQKLPCRNIRRAIFHFSDWSLR